MDEIRPIFLSVTGRAPSIKESLELAKGPYNMEDITNTVTTLGGIRRQVTRRVIGDSPEHGKHLLWDSDSNTTTQLTGGLAFSLGVACMEAELACDENRLFRVMHPNLVVLYDVKYHQGFIMIRKAT